MRFPFLSSMFIIYITFHLGLRSGWQIAIIFQYEQCIVVNRKNESESAYFYNNMLVSILVAKMPRIL